MLPQTRTMVHLADEPLHLNVLPVRTAHSIDALLDVNGSREALRALADFIVVRDT